MAAKLELINDVLPLSGSANDFTITDFGTVKAALIIVSGGTLDSVPRSDVILGIGVVDDVADASIGFSVEEGIVTFSNTNRSLYNSGVAYPDPAADAAIDGVIECSLITDGIRMNVTSAPSAAYRFTALLIGGSDVFQAEVIVQDDLGSLAGDQAISLSKVWSSAPNFLLGFTQAGNSPPDAIQANGVVSLGFSNFTDHGQAAIGTFDNTNGFYMTDSLSNTFMLSQTFAGSIAWSGYPHTPTTTGFQFNMSAGGGNDIAVFLAIGLTAPYGAGVFDFAVAADPGEEGNPSDTVIVTEVDEPVFAMALTNEGVSAYDTATGSTDSGLGIVQYDGVLTSAISLAFTDAATNLAKSQFSDALEILDSDTADDSIVATQSFSGFNLVWDHTAAPDGVILGVGFAIGIIDSTAAVLSSPTGAATGHDTVEGSVDVNDNEGIVYAYLSTGTAETDPAVIKSNGAANLITSAGVRTITDFLPAPSPSTTYYANYVHEDAAFTPNQSNVVSSAAFTTDPDPTPIIRNVNSALPTAGTVDITFAGLGTLKGALLFVSGSVLNSEIEDDAVLAIGVMDDVSQGSFAFTAQNAATSNVNSSQYTALAAAPDADLAATLDFDINGTPITDVIRLSIVNAPNDALRVTGSLLGGAGVEFVEAIIQDDLGNAAGNIAIALSKVWSSAPNLVFGVAGGDSTAMDSVSADGVMSFGFSDFVRHGGIAFGGNDNDTGEYMNGIVSTNMLNKVINDSLEWYGYPHTPTTSNFQFNMSAAGGNDIAAFLAIRLSSAYDVSIDTIGVSPSADLGINPSVVSPLFNLTMTLQGATAYNALVSNTDIAAGIVMYDEYEIAAITASISDSVAKSQHSDSLALSNAAGDGDLLAGIPMFTGNKVEWVMIQRPPSALYGVSLTIGETAPPGVSGIVADEIYRVYGTDLASALATHFSKTASESLQDAEHRWLVAQGGSGGAIDDMWVEVFGGGTVTQAMLAHWTTQ